ncbi:outer membrane family protein [Helicobacter acinonychis]|uniref:OMP830 n=1 Tax=Helicobacter acinonychis TaxID=212 RepID=A0A1M4NH44_HELAC|nr:outer membrane family protein [Helicobacter acinonychis]SFZ70732.1 OMP830 [Helicobacter acinonychis]
MLRFQKLSLFTLPILYIQSPLLAFDYKFSGVAESFSKVGFNHSKLNSKEGIFPTATFVTATIKLQVDSNLLPKNIEKHSLKIGVGGILGGLAYDSTKTLIDQATHQVYGSEIYNYIGRWWGFLGNAPWKNSRLESNAHTRNYVLYNSYLFYSYGDKFQLKLGRYLSNMDFMSSYTQGFEVDYKIHSKVALKWFSSFGRALAFGQWIRDWYAPIVTEDDRKEVDDGIHAVQLDFFSQYVQATPFFYFSPKTYEAPGLKIHIDSNQKFKGLGLRAQTLFNVIFPIYAKDLYDVYWRNSKIGKWASSFLIHQRFDYNEFNFGFGYYQNFGNANAKIGWYGNPLPINIRNNSVYGGIFSNAIAPDSLSGYVFGGGVYRGFLWGILGRYTYSTRASETALNLNLGYKWNSFFNIDVNLEYYVVSMHAGYKTNNLTSPFNQAFKANTQDRSNLMVSLKFFF